MLMRQLIILWSICGRDEPPALAPSIVPRVSYSVPQSDSYVLLAEFQIR